MALSKIQNNSFEDAAVHGRRNLVINGAMQVWQRGTTIDSQTSGGYLCDRWRVNHAGLDGNVDVDRSTDVPSGQGFAFSQKISMDASETSLDAGDLLTFQQRFEGQDLQHLLKGTSSAKKVTLSFWVKSSVASTYSVNLKDDDNSRDIGATYTINSADTWEYKTITFDGDTSGAFTNDANRSMDINFWMDAGTTYTSGTFLTSWGALVNSQRVYDTTGWLESTNPEWYITGVQLEVGDKATPFEHRSYGEELALCQRYFQTVSASNAFGSNSLGTAVQANLPFMTHMRTEPSITLNGTIRYTDSANNYNSTTAPSSTFGDDDGTAINMAGFTSLTRYRPLVMDGTQGHFEMDSEL